MFYLFYEWLFSVYLHIRFGSQSREIRELSGMNADSLAFSEFTDTVGNPINEDVSSICQRITEHSQSGENFSYDQIESPDMSLEVSSKFNLAQYLRKIDCSVFHDALLRSGYGNEVIFESL
jgi:hypothetical protein